MKISDKIKSISFKVISLAIAAATTLSCTSCGDGGEQTSGKRVEIRIMSGDRARMDELQEATDEFNETNDKNIHVTLDFLGDNAGDVIKAGYTSESAPEIHSAMGGSLDDLAIESGWYREIDEQTMNEWREKYGDISIAKANKKTGKTYALLSPPSDTDCSGYKFLWNKELFAEAGLNPETPPTTWAEVREFAKKITAVGGGKKYGYVMPFKDSIFTRYYIVLPSATSGLYNADGFDPTKGEYDFSVYAPLIKAYRDIIADGSVFPSPNTIDNDTARAQFAEGNIGMICAAGWDVDVFDQQFVPKQDWGIAEFPVIDTFKGGYPYGVNNGIVDYYMCANSSHPEEQMYVYKWLLGLNKADENKKQRKGNDEFSQYKYPLAKSDDAETPETILKIEGENSWDGLKNLVLNNEDVDAGLQKISDTYNAALQKAAESGEDIEQYHNPNYSFYANSYEELGSN